MPPRRRRGGGQKADADEAKPVAPGQRQRSASGGKGAGRATPVARGRTGGGRGGASRNGEYDSEEARRRLAQAEYDTEVHFQKCFGVMNEIYETNRSFPALPESFNFLDLGCAPGGFSSFLLDDERCGMGYGVTLPAENGGFPARISKHEKAAQYALQYADLFLIEPKDLLPTTNVYSVIADAQYLNDGLAYAEAGRYTGAKCTTKQNGIWALTLKQMWLGFERLETGGYFMVRFGWKDYGDHWSQWYKACALRLFQLLYAVFGEGAGPSPSELYKDGRGGVALDPFRADLGAVTCIKSSYYNASTSSFYVVATNFRREAYQKLEVGKLLQREIATLTGKDAGDHDILGRVVVSPEVAAKVETELENVEKLREIGEATKKWTASQSPGMGAGDSAGMKTVCVTPLLVDQAQLHGVFAGYGNVSAVWIDPMANTGYVKFHSAEEAAAVLAAVQAEGPAELGASDVYLRGAGAPVDEDPWDLSWDAAGAARAREMNGAKPPESVFQKPPPPPGFGAVDGDEGERWRSKKLSATAPAFVPSGQADYSDFGYGYGGYEPGADGYADVLAYDMYESQFDGYVPPGFEPTVVFPTYNDPSTSWVPLHDAEAGGDADFVPLNPSVVQELSPKAEETRGSRRRRGGVGRNRDGGTAAADPAPRERTRAKDPPKENARPDGPVTVRAAPVAVRPTRPVEPARREAPVAAPWAEVRFMPADAKPTERPALHSTLAEHQNRTRQLLASQTENIAPPKDAPKGLHPALRAHQDRTRDLIDQLLKEGA